MRVAIIGSRECTNLTADDILLHVPSGCTQIISGGAAGVDSLAEQAALKNGISFMKILPDYKTYGKNAPLIRNERIAGQADCVLAFWDYRSRGTAAAIAACIERQIPVEIIDLNTAGAPKP